MNPHIETLKLLKGCYETTKDFVKSSTAPATIAALAAAIADMESKEKLVYAMKNLDRAYVSLLEAGRDRIISLGGDCDAVSKMEASSPELRAARESISAAMKGEVF